MSSSALPLCGSCKKADAQMCCAQCKSVFYCDRSCQRTDWKAGHKVICKASEEESSSTAKAAAPSISMPLERRILLVAGSMFDLENDFWLKAFRPQLSARNLECDIIQLKVAPLVSALQSSKYSSVVIFSIGSGGADKPFFDQRVKSLLPPWVANGGRLFLHGEGKVALSLSSLFSKRWSFAGDFYRRTTHKLNKSCLAVPSAAAAGGAQHVSLKGEYCVKACMLSGVSEEERLYAPGEGAVAFSIVPGFGGMEIDPSMCPFAVANFERGKVCFFGDVNAEAETVSAILTICSL